MRLAYMIQAHTDKKHLLRLVNQLVDEDTDIYIHIDKKSEQLFSELQMMFRGNLNIYIVEKRISVNWSGFSQVLATLSLMNDVKQSGKKYDYVHLISGQDYPIKSNKYIKSFLSENEGKEYIEYRDIAHHFWRLKCYNFFRENKKNRQLYLRVLDNLIRYPQKLLVRRNNFRHMQLYFGSQWFTITYGCLLYILKYLEENPKYMRDFRLTACPDEHFFHMIILNSSFKKQVANNNFRYIDWSEGKNSPKNLTIEDYNRLIDTDKLFARKFSSQIDEDVIGKINQISGNYIKVPRDDTEYYSSS